MRNSQAKLDKVQENQIKIDFATLLADIKNPKEMYQFLDSFFKEAEFLAFSKRIAIIRQLSKGHSYKKIQKLLKVSSATISSTADFKDEQLLSKILKKISIDEWAGKLAKKIIKIVSFN